MHIYMLRKHNFDAEIYTNNVFFCLTDVVVTPHTFDFTARNSCNWKYFLMLVESGSIFGGDTTSSTGAMDACWYCLQVHVLVQQSICQLVHHFYSNVSVVNFFFFVTSGRMLRSILFPKSVAISCNILAVVLQQSRMFATVFMCLGPLRIQYESIWLGEPITLCYVRAWENCSVAVCYLESAPDCSLTQPP